MIILICGFLCFHLVFSAPQISTLDEASDSNDLYRNQYSNSESIKDIVPQYDEDEVSKTPDRGISPERSYDIGHNEDDSNINPYESPNRRKESYKTVQDEGDVGANQNYKVIMIQTYKIQEPIRYNVSRIVKKKVIRTRPVVHRIHRTKYGYENSEDGLPKMYYTGVKYNATLENPPLSANSESTLVDGNVEMDKHNVSSYSFSQNVYPVNADSEIIYVNQVRSQNKPNYNKFKPLDQNDDRVTSGQDTLPNPHGYSYTYPMVSKHSVKNDMFDSNPKLTNDNVKIDQLARILNKKYSPELLNTNNNEYNLESGLRVLGKQNPENYEWLYQDVQTINVDKDKGIEKESQLLTKVNTENRNVVDVKSAPKEYSPELSEFSEKLLNLNKFLNNNYFPNAEKKILESETNSYGQNKSVSALKYPIHTIQSNYSPGGENSQSTEAKNNEEADIFEKNDLTRSSIPTSSTSDDIMNVKADFYNPKEIDKVEIKAGDKLNVTNTTITTPDANIDNDDLISIENNISKLREYFPKDSAETDGIFPQPFENVKDDAQTFKVVEILNENGSKEIEQPELIHSRPNSYQIETKEVLNVSAPISNEEGMYSDSYHILDKRNRSSELKLERVYEIRSGPVKILDVTDDTSKNNDIGVDEVFKTNVSPSHTLQKLSEVRSGIVKNIGEIHGSPILKSEKVYEIDSESSKTIAESSENQTVKKVSGIRFGPVKILDNIYENPEKLRSGLDRNLDKTNKSPVWTLPRVYEVNSDSGETLEYIYDSPDLSEISGEEDEEKLSEIRSRPVGTLRKINESTSLDKNLDVKDKITAKLSEIPSGQNLSEIDEPLKQALEGEYDIPSGPIKLYESLSNIALAAKNPVDTEVIYEKNAHLRTEDFNVQTDLYKSLRNGKNALDILMKTQDQSYEKNPEPELRSNNVELSQLLDDKKSDVKYIKHQPHPSETVDEMFPFYPLEYIPITANDGLNYPELDTVRVEQFNANLPSQQYSATIDNLNNELDNGDKVSQDELIKLCKLARTNLKKLRVFVARNYGLNTRTADENDLITIVYIMRTLNEARKTNMPVEMIVGDFLVNLRRLGVLRKSLCKDIVETDHSFDLNFEDSFESIDDINFDANILTRFDQYLLHMAKKVPSHQRPHFPKTTFDVPNTKQEVFTVTPTYREKIVKNINPIKPDYVHSTNPKLYAMPDNVKNMKQNPYTMKPYTYMTKPDAEDTANLILYTDNDLERSNQNMYQTRPDPYTDSTPKKLYTNQPYFTEYKDQSDEAVTNRNIYPLRTEPEYTENSRENCSNSLDFTDNITEKVDITHYYLKHKENYVDSVNPSLEKKISNELYTKQQPVYSKNVNQNNYAYYQNMHPVYVKNKDRNLYNTEPENADEYLYTKYPDYVINTATLLHPVKTDYVKKVSNKLYTNQPDYTEIVDQNDTVQNMYNTEPEYVELSVYTKHPDYTDETAHILSAIKPDYAENIQQNIYQTTPDVRYEKSTVKPYTTKYKESILPESMEFIDEHLFAIKQTMYPLSLDDIERTNEKLNSEEEPGPENRNKEIYTTQSDNKKNIDRNLYHDVINQNVYTVNPDYFGNTEQTLRPFASGYEESTNENLYSYHPDYTENIYHDLYEINQNTPPVKPYHYVDQKLYTIEPEYVKRTNKNLYKYEPVNKENYYQNLYPKTLKYIYRPYHVENKNPYFYTNEPEYTKTTNEHLFTNPSDYTNQPDYTDHIDDIYSVNQYRYPVEPNYEEKTNQHLYRTRPEYLDYPSENLYSYQPKYIEKTKEDLFTNKPDFINQNIYSVNKYNNPVGPEYMEKTNLHLYTNETEYIDNTRDNFYTNQPDYTDDVVQNLNSFKPVNKNQNLPLMKPSYRERTTQNWLAVEPDNMKNIEKIHKSEYLENMIDEMDIILQKMYSVKPPHMENKNENYPKKPVEREDGSAIVTSPDALNIKVTDIEYESPEPQEDHPVTEGVTQQPYLTSPYYTFAPSTHDREIDTTEKSATDKSADLQNAYSTTPLQKAKYSYTVDDADKIVGKTPQDSKANLNSPKKLSSPKKSKSYDYEGISNEDYNQLSERLKQYDFEYEYEHAKTPGNDIHTQTYNINNRGPDETSKQAYNYNRDWLKMYLNKSFKNLGHFDVYLNDRKLYFWPGNANKFYNENAAAHNVRIKGYIKKVDLETLVAIAHYHSVNYDSELVLTKELSLLLEARDKIDVSIITNIIWYEILGLRTLGHSEEKIGKFVHKLVTSVLPYVFRDSQKCNTERLRTLLYYIKQLESNG